MSCFGSGSRQTKSLEPRLRKHGTHGIPSPCSLTAGAGTLPFCLMNRRQFLDPCQLALRTGQVLGASDELRSAARDSSAQGALLRVARQAMATTFEVCVPF